MAGFFHAMTCNVHAFSRDMFRRPAAGLESDDEHCQQPKET